jgi:hypothetical protein
VTLNILVDSRDCHCGDRSVFESGSSITDAATDHGARRPAVGLEFVQVPATAMERIQIWIADPKLSPEIVARLYQPMRTRQRVDRRTALAAQLAPALKG